MPSALGNVQANNLLVHELKVTSTLKAQEMSSDKISTKELSADSITCDGTIESQIVNTSTLKLNGQDVDLAQYLTEVDVSWSDIQNVPSYITTDWSVDQ